MNLIAVSAAFPARPLLQLLAVLLGAVLVSGCSGGDVATPSRPAPEPTISVTHSDEDQRAAERAVLTAEDLGPHTARRRSPRHPHRRTRTPA